MMSVAGSIGRTVNVGQGFGVTEIAGFSYREVKGNGSGGVPIRGDLKPGAEGKIGVRLTPSGSA
jgi:hypothetical protein